MGIEPGGNGEWTSRETTGRVDGRRGRGSRCTVCLPKRTTRFDYSSEGTNCETSPGVEGGRFRVHNDRMFLEPLDRRRWAPRE